MEVFVLIFFMTGHVAGSPAPGGVEPFVAGEYSSLAMCRQGGRNQASYWKSEHGSGLTWRCEKETR